MYFVYFQIGNYDTQSGELYLAFNNLSLPSTFDSQCDGKCSECLHIYKKQKFYYKPEDINIGGLFQIHDKGQSSFKCGKISVKPSDLQNAEAMLYAIKKINEGSGPVLLNGVKLGSFILDGCTDPVRSTNILSSVYSGALSFEDNNEKVDTASIKAWIVDGNDAAVGSGSLFSDYGIPYFSPSGTSSELTNQNKFQTLYRTVPSDEKEAAAIVKFLSELGWTYVQTVNSPDVYGRSAVATFKKIAEDNGICVHRSYEISSNGSAPEIVFNLLERPQAKVIILFVSDQSSLHSLMRAKQIQTSQATDLIFIGSTRMSTLLSTVKGAEDVALGTIVLSMETKEIPEFKAFLNDKSGKLNPWRNDYYQAMNASKTGVKQHQWVKATANAVYAFAQALQKTLQIKCGQNYTGVCDAFKNDADINKKIIDAIGQVKFTEEYGENFGFSERETSGVYTLNIFRNGEYKEVRYLSSSFD